MRVIKRLSAGLVERRRVAIVFLLAVILAIGAGAAQLEEDQTLQEFSIGSDGEAALESLRANFSTGPENETVTQVILRGGNVLDEESLVASLELQRELRRNETIAPTLRDEWPTVGVANIVARTAIEMERPGTTPTIDRQIETLEAMDQRRIDAITARILADEGESDALALMPNDYESGSTNASATMIVVFQTPESATAPGTAPNELVESGTAIRSLSRGIDAGEVAVVGDGIITAEQEQSRSDTLAIVGPLALLFVLVTLVVVYRDLLDIALSFVGIVLVQVWTFGTLGWVGIAFNPVLIAIPVLLVGLSIDYGIHVFTRYRERRAETGDGVADAMAVSLGGVGVALVWVTVTTVVGFLSNLASPVQPIRELGIIAAVGIVGALVVFGAFLPPLKVELDALLERVGFDRSQRPIGTGGGRAARFLSVGSTAARKAPVGVVVLTLLVTGVATVAATGVSTSFEPEDNIADGAPDWAENLPEPFAPAEYSAKEDLKYANERFVRHDSRAEILVEGDVTASDTLERVAAAEAEAGDQDVAVLLANGEPRTTSPVAVMERVAATDDSFREVVAAADTDGDGVPDENLERVYDRLFETAPEQASAVVHREDGEYEALRVAVSVDSGADGRETTDQMRAVANVLDGDGLSAIATGDPIVDQSIQDYLLETLLTSLALTILVVVALLAFVYRVVHDSATLGVVTLLPVVAVVSWIVGTMAAIGYPLSVLTTVVASITIGIGIDYSIHMSERFRSELERTGSVDEAIATTTRGTGSALFGSAATTAAGFGVLGFALLPMLQQFGTITAIMIVYAFLASVLVLPSLLVLWARYIGPVPSAPAHDAVSSRPSESPGD